MKSAAGFKRVVRQRAQLICAGFRPTDLPDAFDENDLLPPGLDLTAYPINYYLKVKSLRHRFYDAYLSNAIELEVLNGPGARFPLAPKGPGAEPNFVLIGCRAVQDLIAAEEANDINRYLCTRGLSIGLHSHPFVRNIVLASIFDISHPNFRPHLNRGWTFKAVMTDGVQASVILARAKPGTTEGAPAAAAAVAADDASSESD